MNVLIDECLPAALRAAFTAKGYECETVRRAGFGSKKNGELLALAEGRWDVLLTNDRRMKHQQNMAGRKLAIVVLLAKSNRIEDLQPLVPACSEALLSILPGQIAEVGSVSTE